MDLPKGVMVPTFGHDRGHLGLGHAGPEARLRIADRWRPMMLAFTSRRAVYELAARLALPWSEVREDTGAPTSPRRP